MGGSLEEVLAVAQKAIDNTRSMGVGLSPCILPEVGHPNFTIEPGTMEIGIGHHGEPGIEVAPLESAEQIARRMCDVILPDLPFKSGDEVVVLVSLVFAVLPISVNLKSALSCLKISLYSALEVIILYGSLVPLVTKSSIKTPVYPSERVKIIGSFP